MCLTQLRLSKWLTHLSKFKHTLYTQRHRDRQKWESENCEFEAMEAVIAAKPIIKVAALCGSLRKGSYNRGLVRSGTFSAFVFSTVFYFAFGNWVLIVCVFCCSNRVEQVHQWLGNGVHRHITIAYAQHWFGRRRNFPTSRGSISSED